ncbi:MAG: hypothetical protein K9N10_15965 [Deltaproteobacteria bacterium]|nr:hypothetical protein [Deltaproteobacteria bacterium]
MPYSIIAARTICDPQYNATLTLKALSFFGDGNLMTFPDQIKQALMAMVKTCDLSKIPEISTVGYWQRIWKERSILMAGNSDSLEQQAAGHSR